MTALQELIKKWQVPNEHEHRMIYLYFIEDAKSLLEKEKQQIARAFDMADSINTGNFINGLDYYKQEYEQ